MLDPETRKVGGSASRKRPPGSGPFWCRAIPSVDGDKFHRLSSRHNGGERTGRVPEPCAPPAKFTGFRPVTMVSWSTGRLPNSAPADLTPCVRRQPLTVPCTVGTCGSSLAAYRASRVRNTPVCPVRTGVERRRPIVGCQRSGLLDPETRKEGLWLTLARNACNPGLFGVWSLNGGTMLGSDCERETLRRPAARRRCYPPGELPQMNLQSHSTAAEL